jgi:hypothetical protein
VFSFGKLRDVLRGVEEHNELATIRQNDRIEEGLIP